MTEESHPLIRWYEDYQDGSQETEQAMRRRFVNLSDEQRTRELQNFSSWFREGSNLRAKAELMKLGRSLNDLHRAMRRVGR
jgi:hypothetical protein